MAVHNARARKESRYVCMEGGIIAASKHLVVYNCLESWNIRTRIKHTLYEWNLEGCSVEFLCLFSLLCGNNFRNMCLSLFSYELGHCHHLKKSGIIGLEKQMLFLPCNIFWILHDNLRDERYLKYFWPGSFFNKKQRPVF